MIWIRYGSLFLLLAVALGAFGAHGLKDVLSAQARQTFQTGVLYHLVHGLGLLALGWVSSQRVSEGLINAAGWAFIIGIVLFSGSLYALSLTGIRKLGMITPFGGAAFLVGWLCLALSTR